MSQAADSQGVEKKQQGIGHPYSRFLVASGLVVAALGALGYAPTVNLAGEAATRAIWPALATAWIASMIGALPIWAARNKGPLEAMPAQFGAMALRLLVILVVGAAVALGGWVDTKPYLIWLVLGHIGLLVTDTIFARSVVLAAVERETEGALEER